MAKRANPTVVGLFVVGAIAVVVAAILVLGSVRWFSTRYQFVCFFGGNVNGLKVGAAVKFRGVPIGSVVEIRISLRGVPLPQNITRAQARTFQLPVIIELDENQFVGLGGRPRTMTPAVLHQMIEAGLRARLSTESVLTGLLYVDLDFLPDTPAHLVLKPGQTRYLEIPTVPTQFEVLQEKAMHALARLDKVDFEGLAQSLKDVAVSFRNLAQSEQLKATLVSLNNTLESLQKTSRTARDDLNNLSTGLRPLIASLKKTSDQASLALQQAQTAMVSLQQTVNPNSPAMYNLSQAAANLAQASRAVRDLANELQRNPSVLIRGRTEEDQNQKER